MGKYHGSPWGYILGKLFDTVGGSWKGVFWNRVRIFPTQRGTLDLYRQLKDGLIDPSRFSYPQMNIRRAVTQVLGYIARSNLANWIYPIWETLVTKRGWTMTGSNAFVKRNANTLLNSMTNKGAEFDAAANTPDLEEMLVSDGDLEATTAHTATYDPITGVLQMTWVPTTFTNGQPGDIAYAMVAKKPLMESVGRDGSWYPALFMYGPYAPLPPTPAVLRSNGTMAWTLPTGLTAADLTAYIFFHDDATDIGYSKSEAAFVVPV